jgi:uncharacterized phage infection (PIP) family protein YhgE
VPLLNDLLLEAVASCEQLTENANEAEDQAEALTTQAGELTSKLGAEAAEVHQDIQGLIARLDAVEAERERAGERVAEETGALAQQADTMEQRVAAMLTHFKDRSGEFQARQVQWASQLEARLESSAAEMRQLSTDMDSLQEEAARQLGEVGTALDTFRTSVDTAHQGVADLKVEVIQALVGAETFAAEAAESHAQEIGTLVHQQTESLIGFANKMLSEHNETVLAVRRKYADEATQNVTDLAEAIESAFDGLKDPLPGYETAVKDQEDAISQRVDQALDRIGRIKTVLAKAGSLS